jgi:tetratricopeptide (TPR) repeat protein
MSRTRLVLIVVLLVARTLGALRLEAAEEIPHPQTAFFQANALYKDGQYAQAAQQYEQLLRAGMESGPLYFNLGNAYFKMGDRGRAVLNYERARRLMPGDPDVRANLTYAQSLSGATTCDPPLWRRLLFPLAQRLSVNQLFWLTGTAYSALFLLLAARRLLAQRPRWLLYAAEAAGIPLIIGATSLAYQLIAERQPAAVVVRDGDNAVRFEPAESGTVHYVLKEGSLLQVLETRDGWWQVARCDGRRGWIQSSALETLRNAE